MYVFLLLLLLSLLMSFFSSSTSNLSPLFSSTNSIITLRLTRVAPHLKYQAAASLERTQYLKKPNVQLYPRGMGKYTISLGFGTPPQALGFVMDTGSSLTWFPCTQSFNCFGCYTADIPIFIPKSSSSYKPLVFNQAQCRWFLPYTHYINKNQQCVYKYPYGSGNTDGELVFETLTLLPGLSVHNFIAGCSISSPSLSEGGIMGFGRALVSLPSQMGLKSFSYCMVSHDFDNNATATSDLVLTTTTTKRNSDKGVQYTPFTKNPKVPGSNYLLDYYYVGMQSISVGGIDLKVPANYLEPDVNGYGGTIVDSGTVVATMKKPVFDLVFNEFQRQVGNTYRRDTHVESFMGLGLCYNVSGRNKNEYINLPHLTFRFIGGVEMVLPLPNYFSYVDKQRSLLCMTIINSGGGNGKVGVAGPSIILGNYQQQNYYMEYDLENNRLGIRQQKCKSGSG